MGAGAFRNYIVKYHSYGFIAQLNFKKLPERAYIAVVSS